MTAAASAASRLAGGDVVAEPASQSPSSWYYAKYFSTLLEPDADLRKQRRHVRRAQRSVLWDRSKLDRVRSCGRVPIDDVTVRDNAGVAHYAGLRHVRVYLGLSGLLREGSQPSRYRDSGSYCRVASRWNTVLMVTLTFPHDMSMRLAELLPVVTEGFRSLISVVRGLARRNGSFLSVRRSVAGCFPRGTTRETRCA